MNVLQITKKVPWPLRDGEAIAIHYISKGLVEAGCTVHLLSFNTKKHYVDLDNYASVDKKHYSSLTAVDLDTTVRYGGALKSLISGTSYNVQRFRSLDMEKAIQRLLASQEFDVVQLETLYLAPYISVIRKHSSALIALRSHNIESEIWQGLAAKEKSSLKSWYYGLSAGRLMTYEKKLVGNIDCLIPLSRLDAQVYGDLGFDMKKTKVIPIGLDLGQYDIPQRGLSEGVLKMGLIGSLDWKPNQEGVEWFVGEVWEGMKKEFPRMEFHLAGRNMPERYLDLQSDGFIVHGEVEDALAFMSEMDVICVPLFSGSGVKVKILESMAMSKLVISTPKGFEDIDVKDGINAMVAKSKAEFVSAVRKIISAEVDLYRIQKTARSTMEADYDYKVIAENLKLFYQEII